MPCRRLIDHFDASAKECQDAVALGRLLHEVARELGFHFFALVHHASLSLASRGLVRLDTYPEGWAEEVIAEALTSVDPVHHACRQTCVGFSWDRLADFTRMGPPQRAMLDRARYHDIGNGFTVPINLPGEPMGSCTFAVRCGSDLPYKRLLNAEQLGAHAFQFARPLFGFPRTSKQPRLSRRELQCIRLLAAGFTQRQSGAELGISPETVYQYLKHSRSVYGVANTTQLLACALRDGLISYDEAIPPREVRGSQSIGSTG